MLTHCKTILTNFLSRIPVSGWIIFSFAAWLVAFRDFISTKAYSTSDAIAYIMSSLDLVSNLKRGVWPLWLSYYGHGVPFDFFTQRMGAYNPLYTFMTSVYATKVFSFPVAYLLTLSLYYFLGMIGFYLLLKKIYHDRRVAFGGFILLLFSSLGIRIFDSFLCLMSVPLIWFFYFLTAFLIAPRKLWFAGCILCAMILCNTYVPFYFIMTFMLVAFCFSVVFWSDILPIFKRLAKFFCLHPLFCLAMLTLFVITLVPSAALYFNSYGNIALPLRHGAQPALSALPAATDHILKVDPGYLKWGAFEELIYSSFFTSVKRFNLGIVFFPLVSLVLILWGSFGRINKRITFFLLTTLLFLLIGSPRTPVYTFFAEHLFFFKYFRNLHFFLWFAVFPLFVLIFSEFLYQLLNQDKTWGSYKKQTLCVINIVLHMLLAVFLLVRGDLGFVATFTIGTSGLFIWRLLVGSPAVEWAVCGALCLLVIPQSLNIFLHLSEKNLACTAGYPQETSTLGLQPENVVVNLAKVPKRLPDDYYASNAWSELANNISGPAITNYIRNTLVFYDRVKPLQYDRYGLRRMEIAFLNDENLAFVPADAKLERLSNNATPLAHPLRDNGTHNDRVTIKTQNTNYFAFATNLPNDKFMVFNDAYHPQWHAFINGKETRLIRANIGFKGLWVPAGKALVEFRFGTPLWYWFNVFIWLIFNALFVGILVVMVRDRRKGQL
ncbi:MAG: hypothetical protein HQL20_00895 [Candidatus Omnitrophica bacterium]|nr:hypothetical protein [Candidatus Omnitrophota bacterium]